MEANGKNRWLAVVLISWCLMMTACAGKSMVILMPEADGSVGSAEVRTRGGARVLNTPRAATRIASGDQAPGAVETLSEREIDAEFEPVLAAEPAPPDSFILYFLEGSETMTDESAARIPEIHRAIQQRKSVDISVIGHSDRQGDEDYNLALSLRRAESVKQALIAYGVPETSITLTSHGEGNPLVPTADDVAEPRNRRVEVIVR